MKKATTLLLSILFLSLLLRLYGQSQTPPSLNWDEVSHGYNAYSVLKTGADQWGKLLPLDNFRAYGDYPLPANLYLTIPFILVLGLSQLAIRLPSILLGAFLVIPGYFLSRQLVKNKKIALLTALLLAVSPWTVLPGRAVFQSTIALFFFTSALALFFQSIKKPRLLPLAVICYGISAYSYHNARIVSVLLLPFLLFFFFRQILPRWKKPFKKLLFFSGGFLLLFFLPLVFILTSNSGRARADWVFLIDQGAINNIESLRNHSTFPQPLTRLAYNKVTYFATQGTLNFLGYFSPQFLFLSGGTQYQYSVPGFGLIFPVFLPFFYFGLFLLILKFVREKDPRLGIILLALIMAPLPGAITQGQDHVLRAALMVPFVVFACSYGLIVSLSWLKYKSRLAANLVKIIVIFSSLFTFSLYLRDLFLTYPSAYSWSWQYGYQEAVAFTKANYNRYERIIFTKKYGEPHEFVLFFWPWNPASYRNDPNLVRYYRSDWYWVDSFAKFYFVNDWEVKSKEASLVIPGKTLLVTSPGNYLGGQKIGTIDFLDGSAAFDLVSL